MIDGNLNHKMAEIMGWEIRIRDYPRPGHNWLYDAEGNEVMALYEWHPSTYIAQAMMVVDRLIDRYEMYVTLVSHWEGCRWTCFIFPDPYSEEGKVKGKNKTLERAICLAAAEVWEKMKGGVPSE